MVKIMNSVMSWTRHPTEVTITSTICDWYSVRICSLDVNMNNTDEKLLLYCRYLETFNRNRHTVPCIPNRYGKRGACAGLSYSVTPSVSQSISHWWARRVPVACLGQVLRGGTGRAGDGGPGGGGGVRGVSAAHSQLTGPILTIFYNFLISY